MTEVDEFNLGTFIELSMQNSAARTNAQPREYQNILSENEERIYNLIIKEPGISKEDVVRHFTDLSRVTTFKNLKLLEEKELIISANNPKNRQTRCIYINRNNKFLKVNHEITEFKSHILQVVDGLEKYFSEIGFDRSRDHPGEKIQYLLNSLSAIFDNFVRFYFSRAMLQWQKNISNDQVRLQLYDIVIENTKEIQRRLSNFFPTGFYDEEVCYDDDEDKKRTDRFSEIGLGIEIKDLIRSSQSLRFNYRKDRIDYSA